jgi:hypothetical protein
MTEVPELDNVFKGLSVESQPTTENPPINSPKIIVSESDLSQCFEDIRSASVLALDCEGVDLGRFGEITIVQVSTANQCYLFDVLDKEPGDPVALFLKEVLESAEKIKIIHDAKMDSDALFHKLAINLNGVHDTQAWDNVKNKRQLNLNRLLDAHSCPVNLTRNGDIYKSNIRFWAKRPLTFEMIEWASGDVKSLFELRDLQLADTPQDLHEACIAASNTNTKSIRDCTHIKIVKIRGDKMGLFIGAGGKNIKSFQDKNPGVFLSSSGEKHLNQFILYADTAPALTKAMAGLRKFI